MLGTALQTGATNLDCIWAGRWFAGMGVGALSVSAISTTRGQENFC